MRSSRPCLSGTSLLLVALLMAPACGDSGAEDALDTPPGADATGGDDVSGDDAGTDDPGESAADAGPDDVADVPASAELTRGLGLDYGALEPGVMVRYEPDEVGLTATPWPTDRLRAEDGSLDLSGFPNPADVDMLEAYLAYATDTLRGYGTNGSVYFELDGPVDMASLPDPQTALDWPQATALLVNVQAGTPRYGEQLPLLFDWYDGDDDPYQEANTLSMRAVFGFPMAEASTYCAILTRAVLDGDGRHLTPSVAFTSALADEGSLAPLVAWLPDSYLYEEDIAAATCFTTGVPTAELQVVREFLHTQSAPVIEEVEYFGTVDGSFHEFQGIYTAPNFQAGTKPYEFEGGQLEFDADGDPVIHEQEAIRFLLMVPTAYQMPDEGWPIVLYAHGTGGDFVSCKTGILNVASDILKEGVAMVCIDQPLHGVRGNENWQVDFLSFNFANPYSGRMSFRQAAIDIMSLARMVAADSFDLDAGTTAFDEDVRIDPEEIHFFGHSHGGLSGAIAFGIEPELRSGVISGAGGILIETILRRSDFELGGLGIKDFVELLFEVPTDELDTFHPTLTLVQMLVDATDPINYAPYWLVPREGNTAKHVFVTEGIADEATPYVTTNALAAAARVPLIKPVVEPSLAHQLRGLDELKLPVGNNITTPDGETRTAGLKQWSGDHFVAFTVTEARNLWRGFFRSIRFGAPPAITE